MGEGFVLKPWQRFHVRVAVMMGAVVMGLLALMGIAYYEVTYSAEFEALQQRIHSTVVILSRRINPARLVDLDPTSAATSPYLKEMREDLDAICRDDKDIASIYVLARTPEARKLRFIADVNDDAGKNNRFGTDYVITDEVAQMERGLEQVTVEEEMSRDKYGLSLSGYAPIRRPDGAPFALVGVDILAPSIEAMRERVLAATLMSDRDGAHEAFATASRSCHLGDQGGCTVLGHCYQGGVGVPADVARANALFARACDEGEGESAAGGCYYLGLNLEAGRGGTADPATVAARFARACEQGWSEACR